MISHIRDDKFNFVCKILYNLIESLISKTEIEISNVTRTYFIILLVNTLFI